MVQGSVLGFGYGFECDLNYIIESDLRVRWWVKNRRSSQTWTGDPTYPFKNFSFHHKCRRSLSGCLQSDKAISGQVRLLFTLSAHSGVPILGPYLLTYWFPHLGGVHPITTFQRSL